SIGHSTQDLLEEYAAEAREAGIDASAQAIEGDAGEVLAEASRYSRLAVVGKRGRNRLASRLLGTVSGTLAADSHCPVPSSRSRSPPSMLPEPQTPRDRTRRLCRLSPVSRTRWLPESTGIPRRCRLPTPPPGPPNSAAVVSPSSRPSPPMRAAHAGPRR